MVFLSFVELYNNTFYDLLADAHDIGSGNTTDHITVHETPTRGVFLKGSSKLRVPVTNASEVLYDWGTAQFTTLPV
jgi:hypothetical protein